MPPGAGGRQSHPVQWVQIAIADATGRPEASQGELRLAQMGVRGGKAIARPAGFQQSGRAGRLDFGIRISTSVSNSLGNFPSEPASKRGARASRWNFSPARSAWTAGRDYHFSPGSSYNPIGVFFPAASRRTQSPWSWWQSQG
jgi:hypothetical protein